MISLTSDSHEPTISVNIKKVLGVTAFVNLGRGCDGKYFSKGQIDLSLPSSPFTYSGNIVHRVIEKVRDSDSFLVVWEREKLEEERRIKKEHGVLADLVLPLEIKDPLLSVKMHAVKRFIEEKPLGKGVGGWKEKKNEISVNRETDVGGAPYATRGTIDLLIKKKNELIVIDYKTGKIKDIYGVKENYRHQLIIYGYCLDEEERKTGAKNKIKLILRPIGSHENSEDWEYNREEAEEIYFKQKELLNQINEKIKKNKFDEIFKPSSEECINCNKKLSCNFYHDWLQKKEFNEEAFFVDVVGKIASIESLIDKNSLICFQDGRQLKIHESKASLTIKPGDEIFVGNILKNRTHHSFFKESNRTFLFVIGHSSQLNLPDTHP